MFAINAVFAIELNCKLILICENNIVTIHCILQDMNDNSPYFTESDIYITLSNKLPVGSNITRVYAFDRDIDDSINYSITDNPGGR